MAEILTFKRPKLSEKYKGKGLCREGLHKWQIHKERIFDVRQGKLITEYRCKRCGKKKVQLL